MPLPDPSPCRSITFANGITLEFADTDVPAPPAVSFADNLALLNQMWDDAAPHWQGCSELVICGVPVPVKYWKDIYSRSKSNPGQWKGVKSNWSLWKVQLLLSWLLQPVSYCSLFY